MSWYLTLPLVTPFATAVVAFFLRGRMAGRVVAVAGSALALLFAMLLFGQLLDKGVLVGQMGGWPAPFGITLAADLLSGVMVLLTALSGLAVTVFAFGEVDAEMEQFGFHTLLQLLLGGVTGAFLTGDLFNLYVWFEVLLISSFALLVLGGKRVQIDGAVKYVTLNLVSTVVFLSAIGLLYGITGTLNMADLRGAVDASDQQGLLTVVAMMFMIAFGMKAAAFPLFFWLPAAYHTPAFAVSAVFAGLLSKVGVYALFRAFTLIFDNSVGYTHTILLWVAALTMITGILGALAQTELRRVLSFQIVSSIGFLLLGLALYTPLAIAGAMFYLIHNIVVKVTLFLVAGIVDRTAGGSELGRIGGLYASAPLLAVLFLVPAFALAGFPPLSGFWAKVLLVQASLEVGAWLVAGIALVVGLLTIWSLMQIWAEAFWKEHPDAVAPDSASLGPARLALLAPVAGLAAVTIGIGLSPQPVISFSERVAEQLLDPEPYVTAVLGAEDAKDADATDRAEVTP